MCFAFVLALVDRVLRLGWLSALARRVAFVLVPPLILIFLVLGTIYLGVATPTEGGALGALGALAMAAARGRLQPRAAARGRADHAEAELLRHLHPDRLDGLHPHLQQPGRHALDRQLFRELPGGATGLLVVVTALVFVLGFFLDFFEIAFILVPLLAPVAEALGIDLVWFGVLLGVNLQTSFLTPPFGYALFFLRGVAPAEDRIDAATGGRLRASAPARSMSACCPSSRCRWWSWRC